MPINELQPRPPPAVDGSVAGCRAAWLPGSRTVEQSDTKQTMRLSRTEWMWVAVAAGSIACFGTWLQSEMNRAALARIERETQDMRGTCAGMSAQDAQMMDKGELWCGEVGAGRADSPGKE